MADLMELVSGKFGSPIPSEVQADGQLTFVVTPTKEAFEQALAQLHLQGVESGNVHLPRAPKSPAYRKNRRLRLEVPDMLDVERQREAKRRRVTTIANPRKRIWGL